MKAIKYTDETIKQQALAAYNEVIHKLKTDAVACHDKQPAQAKLPEDQHKRIVFTSEAYDKAMALVQLCDKEIAWHGLVEIDDEGTYNIVDILVPPQEVTGTTVDSDPTAWALWASQLTNDELNAMRCHMHSHVNMNVFSSGTDDDYQKDMITKNGDLDYYIFLIFNKKFECFARIYDVENNVMYENDEIDVVYYKGSISWANEQIKEQVKTKTYANNYKGNLQSKTKNYGGYGHYGNMQGYGGWAYDD